MILRFIRELRRRKLLRTGALYVIGAWLVLQVADVLFPGFGIPDAAIRALVWTAVAGFPFALVFGWFFDIGPAGIRRTLPVDAEEAGGAPALTRSDYVILAAFLLVAGVLIYNATEQVLEAPTEQASDADTRPPAEALPKLENSVAVLPFDNISADPNNEFFCDGISEEILHELSAFRQLNVIGRTSSFAFKDSNYGIARISRALGTRYVLQGSVRKYKDQLRISAQLLDEGGRQIWSLAFDRQLRNVFEIQTEIAAAVAATVVSQVVPHTMEAEPPDIEAYELYVTGREWLHRRNWVRAREDLKRAVAVDPDFAAAHAELAIALLLVAPSREEIEHGRQHFTRALALKPGLLRARVAQALALLAQQPPDKAGAERLLREVLTQDPNMSDAQLWLGGLLADQGRDDDALEILQRAHRIDPLHPSIAATLAKGLLDRGETDEAVRLLQHQLERPRPGYTTFVALSGIYGSSGRLVEMNRIVKAMALKLAAPHYFSVALNYAVLGQWTAADYWLERSMRDAAEFWALPFYPTILPVWQGHYEHAVHRFREIMDARELQLADQGADLSFWFGALLARAGEYSAAIDLLAPRVQPDASLGSSSTAGSLHLDGAHALAWSYIRTGVANKAMPVLEGIARQCQALQQEDRLHASPLLHYCAENALLRGDQDRAMGLFEQAVGAGWREYYIREHDPYWASLRDNPRFSELMTAVKTDVDRQSAEVERLDREEDFIVKLDDAVSAAAQ